MGGRGVGEEGVSSEGAGRTVRLGVSAMQTSSVFTSAGKSQSVG